MSCDWMRNERVVLDTPNRETAKIVAQVCREERTWNRQKWVSEQIALVTQTHLDEDMPCDPELPAATTIRVPSA